MHSYIRTLCFIICIVPLVIACGGGGASGGDTAGPVESWSVNLAAESSSCVKSDGLIELDIAAIDASGQQVSNPAYTVSADPADGIEAGPDGALMAKGEGPLSLTVTYTGDISDNSSVTPVVLNMMRDSTPPVLSVTSPARGVMFTPANIADVLNVEGLAEDGLSEIVSIEINGEALSLAGTSNSEAFNVPTNPVWGTNVIHVTATDTCGNIGEHSQAFLWSEDYLAPVVVQDAAARSPAASSLRLTQEVIDDGDRRDFDDVTTLAAQYLQQNLADLVEQAMPSTLYSTSILSCDYSATFPSNYQISMNGPFLTTELVNGQTRHVITTNSLSVPVRYRRICRGLLGNVLTDYAATFTHSVTNLTSRVNLGYSVDSNNQLVARVISSSTTNSGFSVDSSAHPTLARAITSSLTWFADVNTYINNEVNSQLRRYIPIVMADMMETLTQPQPITLPAPFSMSLNVAADWSSVAIDPAAIEQVMGHYVYPNNVVTPYADRGAITRLIAAETLETDPGPISYAANDDGINQALWAFWYGGGLELSNLESYANLAAEGDVDLTGVSLQVSGLLPPVLMPSSEARQMIFGLGDVHVTGSIDLEQNTVLSGTGIVEFDVYASAILHEAVRFNAADNNMNLVGHSVDNQTYIHINALTIGGMPVEAPSLVAELREYLKQVMQPTLVRIAHDTVAAIKLPQFRTPLPAGSFGTDSGIIFDILQLARESDRFVVTIDADPDISADIPIMLNWNELQLAASNAARQEANRWLMNARVRNGWCRIDGPSAIGQNVLESLEPMGLVIKDALLNAGASDRIARDWNRSFKVAWARWANTLRIPALPWYPEFSAWPGPSAPPTPNVPSPLSHLTSPGQAAMSPPNLSNRLQSNLSYITGQAGAVDAFDAFANTIGNRFTNLLSIEDGVFLVMGTGPVPGFNPPFGGVAGPVIGGRCWGGQILSTGF